MVVNCFNWSVGCTFVPKLSWSKIKFVVIIVIIKCRWLTVFLARLVVLTCSFGRREEVIDVELIIILFLVCVECFIA